MGDGWIAKRKNQNFLHELQARIEINNQLKNSMERAIILFNEKPKRGLEFLSKNRFLDGADPEKVAEFLLTTPGLSKHAIGQYIGSNDDFCVSVLRAFTQKLDFAAIEIDEALRLFLAQFRLPGEADQIDRIMESFSATYYADNPTSFEPPLGQGGVDSVYVLAYSLIFLNTLNHNPSVAPERKLTREMFRKQNLYSNPGFPVAKLDEIYSRIMK